MSIASPSPLLALLPLFRTGAVVLAVLIPTAPAFGADGDGEMLFRNQIAPLLQRHCLNCHNPHDRKGGLSLATAADMQTGGDSGPPIVAADPAASYLLDLITPSGDHADMPQGAPPLSIEQVDAVRRWIAAGAPWPKDQLLQPPVWWSLAPLATPRVPDVGASATDATDSSVSATGDGSFMPAHPVDAYVLAAQRERGLSAAPEADRRTLIRRLTFDLLGLPPSPAEIATFLNDSHPNAYQRLVDRLLASPHYGERWARHWLDVVHYGETHGYDKDKLRPNAWPYRDYVIRAMNQDKPYGRFVQEQIAGDVLFPGTRDGIEALGFIAAGPWDFIGHAEVPETKIDGRVARHLDRDDMVQNAAGTFLSLTVGCAQCHDHKFDPIPQRDYYAMQAVFAALDRADRPYDVDPQVAAQRAALAQRHQRLQQQQKRLDRQQPVDAETLAKRAVCEAALRETADQLAQLPPTSQVYAGCIHHGSGAFRGTGPDGGRPRPVFLLARGDVTQPQDEVVPGALSCLDNHLEPPRLGLDSSDAERRAALAHWLSDRRNPLVWRSIANRLWLYHFGRGLVETPNDFGRMGQPPTHPELLDWLACQIRDADGSLKRVQRMIVTSATYRQRSDVAASLAARDVDPDNRFYWRMNRRQLEAEAVRDAMLVAADCLNRRMGGPSFRDFVIEKPEHSPHYRYDLHDPHDPQTQRRSIYRFLVRSQTEPLMTALDCADPSMQVARRNQTNTPLQALALMNNQLPLAMSQYCAASVRRAADDLQGQVRTAFHTALSRPPAEEELAALLAYAKCHGLENTCRVILNLSEFVFVD